MRRASSGRRRFSEGFSLLVVMTLGGCATTIPEAALRLPESTLDLRSMQTRTLEASSEIDILAATIAVLQDMEFNIERIEKPLGVITASKVTDADSTGEKAGLLFLDILCALGGGGCDAMSTAQDDQHITLTMVVLPSLSRSSEYKARITIQRAIYDKMDRIKVLERINDAKTYQQIFDNLRKSLFIQVGEK
jgi:hypothetical protein